MVKLVLNSYHRPFLMAGAVHVLLDELVAQLMVWVAWLLVYWMSLLKEQTGQ